MKSILIIVVAFLTLTMCTNIPQNESKLQIKNDSLERLIIQKDSAVYAIVGTFNAIENNLATIKAKENIISLTLNDIENQQTREEKINEDINMIYDLMKENKDKVAKLEQQLKSAYIKNNDLQKTVQSLQNKLAEKDAEIIQLRQHLMDQNLRIDELTYALDTLAFDNTVKKALIEAQDESLHEVYYMIGTEKELKEFGVLDKKGIFIGIGSGKSINEDFDKNLFEKIDYRETTELSFDAKKVNIITNHPSNSYELTGEKPFSGIKITNPDEFWSISKYLVISISE